jgi:hypothetical protein
MRKIFLIAFVLLGLILVSEAQTKHTIGERFGGGIVFYVDATGEHGLIAETIDQSGGSYHDHAERHALMGKHSKAGETFTDWQLPSIKILQELYKQREIVGGFSNKTYWSASGGITGFGRYRDVLNFGTGSWGKGNLSRTYYVRAVRFF